VKRSSDVLDAINALERRFPVHAWRAHDIDLWPVYRIGLYMSASMGLLSGEAQSSRLERLRQRAKRATRTLWRVPLASWRDRPMNARVKPGTAAIAFSDGVSFTLLDGKWFDRIVDPLTLALQSRGLRTLKLTPLDELHVPRAMPSRFIQPEIDRIKLLASSCTLNATLPEFDAFLAAAGKVFGVHAPARDWLTLRARWLDRLADWFASMMRQTGASHAFVNTYYSLEGMAFIQAARRAGACSVDLQHGMQGPQHGAYGRWVQAPAAGYSTLPDEFWVWSEEDAAAIDAWRGERSAHRPHVIGNLWRDQWLDDNDSLVGRYVAQARARRSSPPATIQALVCLSWGLAAEESDKLIRAAKLCGPSVGWWWRLHPVEAGRRDQFAATLARHGLATDTVGPATDLPLYALLRVADVLLAHSSTVIQEAALFGVPSVVTSDYGAELHAGSIRDGMATLATTEQAIAQAVLALGQRQRPAATARTGSTARLNALVDTVFARPGSVAIGSEVARA